jgi:hypothetical protein
VEPDEPAPHYFTNADTLNYFAVVLCRLGPTIRFHSVTQIGAKQSELVNVMGKMEKIVFIDDKWNVYAPISILLILVMALFAFMSRHTSQLLRERKLRFRCEYDGLRFAGGR